VISGQKLTPSPKSFFRTGAGGGSRPEDELEAISKPLIFLLTALRNIGKGRFYESQQVRGVSKIPSKEGAVKKIRRRRTQEKRSSTQSRGGVALSGNCKRSRQGNNMLNLSLTGKGMAKRG